MMERWYPNTERLCNNDVLSRKPLIYKHGNMAAAGNECKPDVKINFNKTHCFYYDSNYDHTKEGPKTLSSHIH